MTIIPQKRCTKCGVEKLLTAFSLSKAHKGGYHAHCKACYKAWYDANKARIRETKNAQRAANPEFYRNQERARYRLNPDQTRNRKYQWYWSNAESRRAARNKYYWANVNTERAKARLRYQQNDERERERGRLWRKANKVTCRIAYHRYKARRRANGGTFTKQQWNALCQKYDNRCLSCGEQKPLTIDHIIPISKGGSNDISNIQPLCLSCNDRKSNKIIDYRPDKGA